MHAGDEDEDETDGGNGDHAEQAELQVRGNF